jgi:hypothetical protein
VQQLSASLDLHADSFCRVCCRVGVSTTLRMASHAIGEFANVPNVPQLLQCFDTQSVSSVASQPPHEAQPPSAPSSQVAAPLPAPPACCVLSSLKPICRQTMCPACVHTWPVSCRCRQKTLEEHVTCTNPDCGKGRRMPLSFW